MDDVERAVLTALRDVGATSDRPYRRVTRVLQRVVGRPIPWLDDELLRPNWESSDRDEVRAFAALVRLTQPFIMRYPLVDGRGNFGSMDGDPPADPVFSECRLTAMGEAVLRGTVSHLLLNGGQRYL